MYIEFINKNFTVAKKKKRSYCFATFVCVLDKDIQASVRKNKKVV